MRFLSDTLSINYKTKMRSGPRKGGFKFQFSHAQSNIDLCLSPAHLTYSTYLEDCSDSILSPVPELFSMGYECDRKYKIWD